MKRIIEKLFNISNQKEEVLTPEQRLKNYIMVARELEAKHVEDIYKLINILGRKIQYNYFDYLVASGKRTLDPDDSRLEIEDLLISSSRNNLDSGNRSKWKSLFIEKDIEGKQEISLAEKIILPWPWNRDRLVSAFQCIGKDRVAGEWKYDEGNHDVVLWEPLGIGFVWRGNHSMASGIIAGVGKISLKYIVDLTEAYAHITCDGRYYYFDGKKFALVENLDFAIIFELGRILNNHGIKSIQP